MAELRRMTLILIPRKDLADCLLLEVGGMFDTAGQAKEEIEKTPHYKKMVPFFLVQCDILQSPVVIEESTIVDATGTPIKVEEPKNETEKTV